MRAFHYNCRLELSLQVIDNRKISVLEKWELQSLGFGSSDKEISDLLDSENWHLFREHAALSKHYAEWGSGLSTFYVASQEVSVTVLTVETDPKWAEKILSVSITNSQKVQVRHADLGTVGRWGRPEGYSKIENVWNYSWAPFCSGVKPDLLLVDGRFRVHCFLESLLKARRGTKIIFDDYANRPAYHIVEKFIVPSEISGRQALFMVNTKFSDRWKIRKLSKRFSYVLD